jgi:uncharacterized phosphosugar-binding protein
MHSSDYWISVTEIMNPVVAHETNAIGSAGQLCADTIAQGGVIHVFGTGHSAHQAAEMFYRAGGLACVNAILEPLLSVNAGALLSTWTERQPGLASPILDRYELHAGEPMIIFSVSQLKPPGCQSAQRRTDCSLSETHPTLLSLRCKTNHFL